MQTHDESIDRWETVGAQKLHLLLTPFEEIFMTHLSPLEVKVLPALEQFGRKNKQVVASLSVRDIPTALTFTGQTAHHRCFIRFWAIWEHSVQARSVFWILHPVVGARLFYKLCSNGAASITPRSGNQKQWDRRSKHPLHHCISLLAEFRKWRKNNKALRSSVLGIPTATLSNSRLRERFCASGVKTEIFFQNMNRKFFYYVVCVGHVCMYS